MRLIKVLSLRRAGGAENLSGVPAETLIQYTSFGCNATYTLHAFDGKYVRWAVPASWLTGAGSLSREEVWQLVDLSDQLYAHMAELVGGEPSGSGLATVAVVGLLDCGAEALGMALLGTKGIEIDASQLPDVKEQISGAVVHAVVRHELAHSFDIYSSPKNYLEYGSDAPHAWTALLVPYIQVYNRSGEAQTEPRSLLGKTINRNLAAWNAAGADASWAKCVRDSACRSLGIDNRTAWAGFVLRFARLHGPAAVRRAFAYLRDYKAQGNPAPVTPEEKNDLLVKALAAGAGRNITCQLDAWRWDATAPARSFLAQTYTSSNPACVDADGDGFSGVQDDFDDRNPAIRPGATEVVNDIDDDCNGIIDDVVLNETSDLLDDPAAAFNAPAPVNQPVRLRGSLSTASDKDYFHIDTRQAVVRIRSLSALSCQLVLGYVDGGGVFHSEALDVQPREGGALTTLFFPEAGAQYRKWVVGVVSLAGGSGGYELTVEGDRPLPPNPLNVTASSGTVPCSTLVTATFDPTGRQDAQPTHIRFWAGGVGFFQTLPFAPTVSFEWVVPQGGAEVRAQAVTPTHPLTSMSARFMIAGGCASSALSLSSDFRGGLQGWQPVFANYSPASQESYELRAEARTLPPELGVNGTGFYMQGHNRSGDLLMLLKKRLGPTDGIVAGQSYQVNFIINFASNAPSVCGGGSPGGSVSLRAGASAAEPLALPESQPVAPHMRMNVNVLDPNQWGLTTAPGGSIANGLTCGARPTPYVPLQRAVRQAATVTANSDGELWLIAGTHSGFEGLTALYYQRIDVTLVPVNSPPARPILLTEPDTERAVALDSVTLRSGPFPLSTEQNFSSDRRTRILLFAVNLELRRGESISAVTARIVDSQGNVFPLVVESVAKVPNFGWLTQMTVRLPDGLKAEGEARISISLHGETSNMVLVSVR
ncbi:MAG TPA: putative metal-binding motif-containing protein [Pyrinomonadaceae bacterium]|nr:putative metal-binding motif-containing protein [Pyrinomonadaceae bacterium]